MASKKILNLISEYDTLKEKNKKLMYKYEKNNESISDIKKQANKDILSERRGKILSIMPTYAGMHTVPVDDRVDLLCLRGIIYGEGDDKFLLSGVVPFRQFFNKTYILEPYGTGERLHIFEVVERTEKILYSGYINFTLEIGSYESYKEVIEDFKWHLEFDRKHLLKDPKFKRRVGEYERAEAEIDKFMDYMIYINKQLPPMVI